LENVRLVSKGKEINSLGDEENQEIYALLKNVKQLQSSTYFIYYKLFKQGEKHPAVFPLKVHGGMTINDLKQALINDGNLKLDDLSDDTLRIIFRGKLLNGTYCLMQESIVAGSNIVIFSRKRIKKNVKVIVKYPTAAGYNMLCETFDKRYACGTVKLFLHHSKRLPSKYPPFIFLLKNERTGKVVLDMESFEKQDIKDNDCIRVSYHGEPDLLKASGAETLLSRHMKGKRSTLQKDGKTSPNSKSKRSKKLKKENKNLFAGFKKGFFSKTKTRKKPKKKKAKKQDDASCTVKNAESMRMPLRPVMQRSTKLTPITMAKISKPLTNSLKTPLLKSPLASPITCDKNKENISARLNSSTQQINIIKIDGDGTVRSSLQDKINEAKESIESMKQRIGRIQSKSAEL